MISKHEEDKKAYDLKEVARVAAAKQFEIDKKKLLNSRPKPGELGFDCRQKLSGTRPECGSGLCCAYATQRGKQDSVIMETC